MHISTAARLTKMDKHRHHRPGNVQVFHLTFKQFTEYVQVLVFQLLNGSEQLIDLFAMNFRLTTSQNLVYTRSRFQAVSSQYTL